MNAPSGFLVSLPEVAGRLCKIEDLFRFYVAIPG